MAIFEKKPKKLTLNEILNGIDNLSAEEKEKVHAKMQDLYKAEDEREIDKIEKDKADNTEDKDEKAEEEKGESEEIGKDVDEVETDVENDEGETETEEETEIEETKEEADDAEEKIDNHIQDDGEMKAWMQNVSATLEELKQTIAGLKRQPKDVEKTEADRLEALARKYE